MKYSVRVWAASHGDAVPLIYVAEAMARHTASGYGSHPVHGQTLVEVRPSRQAQLLDAANTGQLKVCDSLGRVAPASEIISAAQIPANSQTDLVLSNLHAKTKHLLEWGVTNGDDFEFVDTPGKMFQYDLKNESGEVLEADYYRGSVGGGESEPVAISGTAEVTAGAAKATGWTLSRRQRFQGYGKPLHDFLKAAHIAGKSCPKARDVLDQWKLKPPPEVLEVTNDGLKYYDAKGNAKPADLDAIRKAIDRLVS